jgi:hypothetical protein
MNSQRKYEVKLGLPFLKPHTTSVVHISFLKDNFLSVQGFIKVPDVPRFLLIMYPLTSQETVLLSTPAHMPFNFKSICGLENDLSFPQLSIGGVKQN